MITVAVKFDMPEGTENLLRILIAGALDLVSEPEHFPAFQQRLAEIMGVVDSPALLREWVSELDLDQMQRLFIALQP